MGNPVDPDSATITQKLIYFSCVYTQNLLNGSLSRVYNTSLKIKRLKMDSKPLRTLAKPYKYGFREKGEKKRRKKE